MYIPAAVFNLSASVPVQKYSFSIKSLDVVADKKKGNSVLKADEIKTCIILTVSQKCYIVLISAMFLYKLSVTRKASNLLIKIEALVK